MKCPPCYGWRDKVNLLLFSHDPEAVEALCGAFLIGYGMWLLRPELQLSGTLLRVLEVCRLELLALSLVEDAFGLLLLALGCVQGACVALSIRAEWHDQAALVSRLSCFRNVCAMLAFLSWLALWLMRSTVTPLPTGVYLMPVIMFANAWIYIRLGVRNPDICSLVSLLDAADSPLDASCAPSSRNSACGQVSHDPR